jgi:hypothetical protein
MKTFRPLIFLTALVFLVGLACGLSGGGSDTPAQPQQEQPQNPPAQEEPQSTPPPQAEEPSNETYFTEEFDQDPGWNYFLTAGEDKEDFITIEFTDSLMIFDFEETSIFAYYMYEGVSYEDVRIDIRAENRGKNNNNVSLVCRYSDEGWYEFSTTGGGLWFLYAVTFNEDDKAVYNRIDNGGAASLKQGKEVNEYGMLCEGEEITLFVNDKELKTRVEDDYSFRDGLVGFNISSLNVFPIILEVDWFKVSEP